MRKHRLGVLSAAILTVFVMSAFGQSKVAAVQADPTRPTAAQPKLHFSYKDATESTEKTIGPSKASLKIIDAEGKPVGGAKVQVVSYLDNVPSIIWTGETNPAGRVMVDLNEDLSGRMEDQIDVHYSVRVFADDILQFGMTDLSFVRILNPGKYDQAKLDALSHPQLFTRTLQLEKIEQSDLVTRPEVSIQVVDVLERVDYENADVRMLDVPIADGLEVTVTFGAEGSYTNKLEVGYKKGAGSWSISGEKSVTSSIEASNSYIGSSYWDTGLDQEFFEYTVPVYGPWTFAIETWAHWLDCEGCNFGYYFYYVRPDHFNGGVDIRWWDAFRSSNGRTPSGSKGYVKPPAGTWQMSTASGVKWSQGFSVDLNGLGLGSFTGGSTEQYALKKMARYSVPTWNPDYTQYTFYDMDFTQKKWYVTIIR